MLHQQAVDEDISTTQAAKEDRVNAVIEEGGREHSVYLVVSIHISYSSFEEAQLIYHS